MQFSRLSSSKMEISETDFFDTLTIQNDQISYAKHVLVPFYVFFALFGCWGGGGLPRGLGHNPLMQFSRLSSSRMVVPLPSWRCLAEGNRIFFAASKNSAPLWGPTYTAHSPSLSHSAPTPMYTQSPSQHAQHTAPPSHTQRPSPMYTQSPSQHAQHTAPPSHTQRPNPVDPPTHHPPPLKWNSGWEVHASASHFEPLLSRSRTLSRAYLICR